MNGVWSLQTGPPHPLEWTSIPPPVTVVLITPKGAESPGSRRISVIVALVPSQDDSSLQTPNCPGFNVTHMYLCVADATYHQRNDTNINRESVTTQYSIINRITTSEGPIKHCKYIFSRFDMDPR